ncbi:amino acid ABC transporter ATP-binding protein [Chromatiaceae bacterium AAb-1]|nr:amino acid ABC transporter ATP-binding protein [Chromatiaceae bacterium AAb-1]
MTALVLHHLSHQKGRSTILDDINLTVKPGQVVVILGPSGCGKSTLLRCINGLEPLSAGSIEFGGVTLHGGSNWQQLRQRVGMVFQHYQLFPHLTVGQNLLLGPVAGQKRSAQQTEILARALLEKVGLSDKYYAYPSQLSGGQQQRVAIARALCMQPEMMLFDEITAALDPEMVREVLEVLRNLAAEGMTMLIVTHELGFARAVADSIVFMNAGRIEEISSPEQFFRQPESERARQFLNKFTDIQKLTRKPQ